MCDICHFVEKTFVILMLKELIKNRVLNIEYGSTFGET